MKINRNDVMNLVGMVRCMGMDYPQHKDFYDHLEEKVRQLEKLSRHFDILLQLAYEYRWFLDLFDDEETKKRSEQVVSVLDRMEKHYGVHTSAKAKFSKESTKEEIPFELLGPNDLEDTGKG
jgi:hypothetical protein